MSCNITIKKRASKALANLPKDDYQKVRDGIRAHIQQVKTEKNNFQTLSEQRFRQFLLSPQVGPEEIRYSHT